MAKRSTRYLCKECGAETSSWMGRCPQCGAWDSLTELARVIGKAAAAEAKGTRPALDAGEPARPLPELPLDAATRRPCGLEELDRVLAADDADTLAHVLRDAIVCAQSTPAEQAKQQRADPNRAHEEADKPSRARKEAQSSPSRLAPPEQTEPRP